MGNWGERESASKKAREAATAGLAKGLCSPSLCGVVNPPCPHARTPLCKGKPTPAPFEQPSRWRDLSLYSPQAL